VITGVEGQAFTEDHQNGSGPEVFGAQGPISEFRVALDTIQSADSLRGVSFNRGMSSQNVTLDVGTVYWEYLRQPFRTVARNLLSSSPNC
jgi:hypothetical protein